MCRQTIVLLNMLNCLRALSLLDPASSTAQHDVCLKASPQLQMRLIVPCAALMIFLFFLFLISRLKMPCHIWTKSKFVLRMIPAYTTSFSTSWKSSSHRGILCQFIQTKNIQMWYSDAWIWMLLTHYQSQEYQKLLRFSYTFLMRWLLIHTLEMVMVECVSGICLVCKNHYPGINHTF